MINILPKQIAELISAGEVVERPVSVIKELVENSIDAKSKRITIEIKNGGKSYMRITDDGTGISQEDVPKAFIRFATSKISTKEDLDKIMTLGFRGEALASVSAVSRIEMFTKLKLESLGTHYKIEGSEEILNERTGCPNGTSIIVRDLFYNVPARAKFLKRDVVEGNAISMIVKKLAVSHPEVAFTFIREGRTEFVTYGDNEQYSAVYSIYGKTFAKDLTPVEYTEENIIVSGYTVKPLYAKSNRQYQIFFVNGRAVKSDILTTALEEAYSSTIMTGKFPVCILKLELSPESIDVNIHPTKAEVRFSNENQVFNAVFFAVKNALMNSGLIYDFDLSKTKNAKLLEKTTPIETYTEPNLPNVDLPSNDEIINDIEEKNPFIFNSNDEEFENSFNNNLKSKNQIINDIEKSKNDFIFNQDISSKEYIPKVIENIQEKSKIKEDKSKIDGTNQEERSKNIDVSPSQNFEKIGVVTRPSFYKNKINNHEDEVKLIGEVFKNYIMVEFQNDIIIIDKHAGHERIIYEKLKSQSAYTDRQILIEPIEVLLTDEQVSVLENNRELCISLGFQFEFPNKPYVNVISVPEILNLDDVESAVCEISENLIKNKKNPQTVIIDEIVHSLACKSAIRSNDKTSDIEMLSLAKQIIFNDKIRHCPHGRPVMFTLSKKDLEKQFKRVL
ncbi:MAG: DNA mismatch repair endonuclease MutL [Oscillospiraceae bacterium]